MDAGLLAQYLIIAAAVIVSAWFVARRQFPGAVRRLRVAMAIPLVREGRPPWLRRVGLWIAPPAAAGDASCGGCNGCDPPTPKQH
jgi:hypothetical protein